VTPPDRKAHARLTIRFYTDKWGHPGTRIYEQTFRHERNAVRDVGGLGQYIYHSNLSPPFLLATAGTYWVSVVAIGPWRQCQ